MSELEQRAFDLLIPLERRIVYELITDGACNREIAERVGTTLQVVKNYMLSICNKLGKSNRTQLALFIRHYRGLMGALQEFVEAQKAA